MQGLRLLQQGMPASNVTRQNLGHCTASKDHTDHGNQECQAKGWNEKGHKSVCKILRAANLSMLTLA